MIEKIKNFFKNLFGIGNYNYLEAPKNEIIQNDILQTKDAKSKDSSFEEQIKITSDENKERALKLQNDYKSGVIQEEELSDADFDILSNLYENQIEKTKKSIEVYKNKIIAIKSKLVQN